MQMPKMWDCKWLDGVFRRPIRNPFFADGTRQPLQAPYQCHSGFFTHGTTTQPCTCNRPSM